METSSRQPVPGGAEPATPATSRREPGAGPAEFRFRPFRDGDEDEVVSLWKVCGLVRPWNNPRRDIESARGAETSEIFVAVTGGDKERIVGSIMAGYDGHRGWVYYVAAAPEHRSRGLGGQLMRHAESWLEALGAPKVMLMIREENEGVRRFYEGLGYEVEKRTVMSRRIVMGRWTGGGATAPGSEESGGSPPAGSTKGSK